MSSRERLAEHPRPGTAPPARAPVGTGAAVESVAAPRSPDLERRPRHAQRSDPTVTAAKIGAFATVLCGFFAGGVAVAVELMTPPADIDCAQVVTEYRALVAGDIPQARFLTAKDREGKSIIDRQESARRCGITDTRLIELSHLKPLKPAAN